MSPTAYLAREFSRMEGSFRWMRPQWSGAVLPGGLDAKTSAFCASKGLSLPAASRTVSLAPFC
eukprot:scaffold272800_cov32-Tisochrysis_lutea.AAC.3